MSPNNDLWSHYRIPQLVSEPRGSRSRVYKVFLSLDIGSRILVVDATELTETIGHCMLVSAGCTMVLLVVILPAGRMVSAGCTMVLLVYVPAVCMVSAVGGLFLLTEYIHAAGVVYAANTSIHAAGLVCAGSIMFLLADLFLLVVTCFCCVQLDIAGWLASATSHLVSAGSLHSCWCINVSAA
ncbi:hypothetical protein Tco_1059484 [Tanacetum coccineum]